MKLKNIYISFFGNLIRTFVNYLSLFYLSRKLGPDISGQLNYMLSLFLALRMVFDPGYSNVFFSAISEETKDKKFYKFYFILLFGQLVLPIILFFLLPNTFVFKIWNTDDNFLLLLVFLIVFLQNSLWDFFSKVLESRRLFFQTQLIQITTNTMGLMFLVVLSNLGNLTLFNSVFVLLAQWTMATGFGLYCFTRIEFNTSVNPQTFVLWCRNLLKQTKPLI
jgi:O-antigen/teichoic acid export membrane protein